jgi:glycosyltransferase involved in cell wall biosynthesis
VRTLIVSGIWPPDVGGPASHAPELAAFLERRGHGVEAVVTAEAAPAPEAYPVRFVSRRLPVGVRHAAVAALVTRRARANDVVYATSMLGRASLGATAARRPLVVKLVADEAYERARRRGLFAGSLEEFQQFPGDARVRALRRARDTALARTRHVVCPSAYLAALAVAWGVPEERVTVLPNPSPEVPDLGPPEELRARLGVEGPTLVFAGRLTRQKALEVAFQAVERLPDVTLLVAGEGPERASLERAAHDLGLDGRVRFLGPQTRRAVLELFRAADAAILSSAWENFPHAVVEALAAGTPVIATAAGGVAEVVRDGENGLLVAGGDPEALAGAVARYLEDDDLRRRLRAAAAPSVEHLRPEHVYGRLERILQDASRA